MKRTLNVCLVALAAVFTVFSSLGPTTAIRASSTSQKQQIKPDIFRPGPINRSSSTSRAPGSSNQQRREIASSRTRTSNTYSLPGRFETDITAGSVNFQDSRGQWQPIDDSLVASSIAGYALQNKANRYKSFFPADLSKRPVHVTSPDGNIDFALQGASGRLTSAGATASYHDALPGVTVTLTAQADALKETLTLAAPTSAHSFTYDLQIGTGMTARQNPSGGIDFVDRAGHVQFAFAAPYMFDSSGTANGLSRAVSMKLNSGATVLTVTPDATWLTSSARKYPVVIDPTVVWTNTNYYGGQDCFVQNTAPTSNFCSSGSYTGTTDYVGYDGSALKRGLVLFPIQTGYTHITPNSNILDAELTLTLASSSSAGAVAVGAYPITQSWTSGATWNTRDGTNAWSVAGGSYAALLDAPGVGPAAGAYRWHNLTQTIQNWVNGSSSNYGFLLRATNEGAAGMLQFDNKRFGTSSTDPNRPHLRVQWNNWLGQEAWFKFEGHKLSDRLDYSVNVANGNLMVHQTDLAIKGTGLDEHIDRYYGGLSSDSWHMGNSWNVSVGCDVRLDLDDWDGISYHGPDGYAVLFRKTGSTWTAPPGLDATLVKNGDSTYTLTFHKNGGKFNFQTGGCLQSMVDQNNNTISMSYNGSLQSITDTQHRVTQFAYGSPVSSNFITQITDPAGRTLKYAYNTNKDLTSFTDPANGITQYVYNANDGLSQITDPKGNLINFSYETAYPYRVTQVSRMDTSCPGGSCTTSFAYNTGVGTCNNFGSVVNGIVGNTVLTDANSHATTHCYDNQGRVVKVLDAKNQAAASSYTTNNNIQAYADAAYPSNPTTFTYDPTSNNLTNAAEPTGANSIWNYNQGSTHPYYPDTFTDSQGNAYTYGYSSSNNLTSITNNSTQVAWRASYNANGTVASNTDSNNNVQSYGYDANGNLTAITYPAPLGAVTMGYDGLSRMTSRTDGKGQLTQYAYDVLDRPTQITYADSSTIVYTYDNDGNVTRLQDNTGITTFNYDNLNRQTRKVLPDTTTVGYSYDAVGNLTSLQDTGGTVTYAYDQVNEVTSLTEPNGGVTNFTYNAGYRRTSTVYPNGVTENMTYDFSQRLTEIKATKGASTLNRFAYSYISPVSGRDSDLRWSVTDVNNATTNYSYSALNRLVSASGPGGSYNYGYDANGNLTNNNGVSQAYNAANELTSSGGTTYSYDGNGNETGNNAGLSFAYNAKNQTTSITAPGQPALSMTYTGATQTERVTAGSTNFTYTVLGCGGASTGVGSNTIYTRDNKGQLVEERLPGTPNYVPYYYLFDGMGSVVGLTDGSGSIVNTYSYQPYGKIASNTGSVANPWLFAGGYLDSSTGLYKFGMRYYDPSVARWTQGDSKPGPNLYGYAGDNPVNNVDPSGASSFAACIAGTLSAGIAIYGGWLVGSAIAEVGAAAGLYAVAVGLVAFVTPVAVLGVGVLGAVTILAQCDPSILVNTTSTFPMP